jgi:flagellar biosynthesis/type III secretory pathway protein FliH
MQFLTIHFPARLEQACLANDHAKWREIPQKKPIEVAELTATNTAGTATSPAPFADSMKLLSTLDRLMKNQAAANASIQSSVQELAIGLALEIASTVVRYEVNHHESRIRRLIAEIVTDNEAHAPFKVFLNKVDLERLRNFLQDHVELNSLVQLTLDNSLEVGDCRIESLEQKVVANHQRQLAEIQSQLMECLRHARSERENPEASRS